MQAPLNTVKETVQNLGNQIQIPEVDTQQMATKMGENIKNVSDTITQATSNVSQNLNEFSSQNTVAAGQEFLNSNSIIAKFAFLIFALIVFLFLLNLGIRLIIYFTEPVKSPYLVYGAISGNSNINIPQNPKNADSITIFRSNNQKKGIEFTWTSWLLINDLNSSKTNTGSDKPTFSHIFNKGDSTFIKYDALNNDVKKSKIGVASINNAPGLYISDGTQNFLRVYMDTIRDNNNYIDIDNIPLKKWFHIALRLQNNILDVYINGVISKRQKFADVPKQNYDNVNICYNGGFNGQLSNLTYYDYALGVFDINNIILKGPNVTQSSIANSANVSSNSYYLSNLWYSLHNK